MSDAFQLVSDYQPTGDQPHAIARVCDGLEAGVDKQVILGVTGSGKTFTMANVIARMRRPALILAPNKTLAAQLYGEMRHYFPHNAVEYFVSYYDYYQPEAYVPSTDTFIEKDASINAHIEQMRLAATKSVLERNDTVIIASVSAIYGLGDPRLYLKMVLILTVGEQCDQRQILRHLATLQYTRNDAAFSRATYRVRGDVIDIFPAESAKEAVRIQLFDDEIEKISVFDPLTHTVTRVLSRVTIYPKTHYATPREVIIDTVEKIRVELKQRLNLLYEENRLVEAQRLSQRTQFDIEMMLSLGYCSGIENYSRYLSGREAGQPPPTLFSYLPNNALLFIDESHVTLPQLGAMYRGDRSRKANLVEYGFRLPSALDNRPLTFEEFSEIAPQTVYISATPGAYELENGADPIELVVRPTGLLDPKVCVKPALNQVQDLLSEIHVRISKQERVLVTTFTKKMAEDLTEYLTSHDIKVRYLHSDVDTVERVEIIRDLRLGVFDVLVGINLLREGLDIPEVSLVAVLDADKEGFLRSDRSLIQTMGRAARHVAGTAILYADTITGSMRRAMDETARRREKQASHNQQHGITPTGIKKRVDEVMDPAEAAPGGFYAGKGKATAKKIAEEAETTGLSHEALAKKIQQLEKQMLRHAKQLEFEEAAKLRDRIQSLQSQLFFDT